MSQDAPFDRRLRRLRRDRSARRFHEAYYLHRLMAALYQRGVRSALLEGGPTLAGSFLRARLVDKVVAYLSPMFLGEGIAALGPAGIGTLAQSILVGVAPVDPISFGATALLFAIVLAIAAWTPATRAAATDPATALRAE